MLSSRFFLDIKVLLMRAVLQRVSRASVIVDDCPVGSIKVWAVILVGVQQGDTHIDAEKLAKKILNIRPSTITTEK